MKRLRYYYFESSQDDERSFSVVRVKLFHRETFTPRLTRCVATRTVSDAQRSQYGRYA